MDSTQFYLIISLTALLGGGIGALIVWRSGGTVRRKSQEFHLENEKLRERSTFAERSRDEMSQNQRAIAQSNELLRVELEKQKSDNRVLRERMAVEKEEQKSQQLKFSQEFELLSNRILEEKTQKFTEQNQVNLDALLKPFKEKIEAFQQKVEDTHEKSQLARRELHTKVKMLHEAHQHLSTEAQNLTAALKGDNKTQGNWGELILEKVLESSNLRKGEEYHAQYSATTDEGKRLQPDFVIDLPDGKHLIIDSKVALVNYNNYIDETLDEVVREQQLKLHIIAVKNHIRELNKKNYQDLKKLDSPDFVLMFMPIEASFALAVQQDKELFSYAWDRKVVIVSPSTLLATLRTIASLWKQERQNRNTEAIASHAASLYDKFVGFIDDLQKVEKHLSNGMNAYHDSMKKLSTGRGNLVRQVERLRELGVKSKKSINEDDVARTIENAAKQLPIDKDHLAT